MVDIVINKEKWSCPTSWPNVALEKMIVLEELIDGLPEEVKDHLVANRGSFAGVVDLSGCEGGIFGEFYAKVLSLMGDIPLELCLGTEPRQVADFVRHYLMPFVNSLVFNTVYEPENIREFEWNGERFLLPESGVDMEGCEVPCKGLSAGELCDTTEILLAGKMRYAGMIVTMLCRPEGEEYDEIIAMQRAKEMGRLPMNIVWEVFYLLKRAHSYIRREFGDFFKPGIKVNPRQNGAGYRPGWADLPYIVGRCSPGEVEIAREMNCYDFMKMLCIGVRTGIF